MFRVLFIDRPHPVLEQKLQERGIHCQHAYELSKTEIEAILPDFQGVVLRSRIRIDPAFVDAGVNLRFIAREGVGIEHIDVAYAESKGVQVIISPEGSRDTVAEHAMCLLLNLLNKLHLANQQVKTGQWLREPNRAIELKGKTVGIIGYGNMGTALALRLSGFGCRVLAYDKYKTGFSDPYAQEASLEQVQAEADIISLHIPYDQENHYFVNDAFLDAFAKPIFLINTARGLVLETQALVNHLKIGKVLGAGLDVIEYEELSFNKLDLSNMPEPYNYLVASDLVILSPHIAGWSFESKEGHGRVLADKIVRFL